MDKLYDFINKTRPFRDKTIPFLALWVLSLSLDTLFNTGRQFERDFGSAYQNSIDSAYAQGIASMTDSVGEEFHEDVLSRRLENMTYSAHN